MEDRARTEHPNAVDRLRELTTAVMGDDALVDGMLNYLHGKGIYLTNDPDASRVATDRYTPEEVLDKESDS